MTNFNYTELKPQIERETGFHSYENSTNLQIVFYGTSDMFDTFKKLVGNNLSTGTIVMIIDTGEAYIYSNFKDAWYAC